MKDCIFCKIVQGQIPANVVYEDNAFLAFLDIGPLNEGHTLVIPKDHFDNFASCPENVISDLMLVVKKVAKSVQKSVSSDGYNVLCNNGKAAGQLVNHIHFHIVPRYSGDRVFSKWVSKEYQSGQGESLAKKINENL